MFLADVNGTFVAVQVFRRPSDDIGCSVEGRETAPEVKTVRPVCRIHVLLARADLSIPRLPCVPRASEMQAIEQQQADEPHEETISAEEIEKLAAEMVGDVREGEDDDDDDDDDADDDPEPEPDHDDSDPCEVLLKVHSKILGEFLKAALNHLIGHDLSKSGF